ncbi:hypothetical protein [Sphaerotilus sp.]|uniref:hypothetical protein n=1 Tax=Sphaerotilus sp. TaxID=2093942 RepID=UPI00286D9E33|nr:hypothetical protein [Sphaerotilus sp.]
MNKSFNINVSGGNVSLGSAAQGDQSSISGTSTMHASSETGSQELYKLLEVLARRSEVGFEAHAAAQSHAKELVQAIKTQDKSKVSSALEVVQKNFSWAYPALKDFVKVAWPGVLTTIGGLIG